MIKFDADYMKYVGGKNTDNIVIWMYTDNGASNNFCKSLLDNYFHGKLTIAKINNIVRKFGGYIEVDKSKWAGSTAYTYYFKNLNTAKAVADAINAVALAKILQKTF